MASVWVEVWALLETKVSSSTVSATGSGLVLAVANTAIFIESVELNQELPVFLLEPLAMLQPVSPVSPFPEVIRRVEVTPTALTTMKYSVSFSRVVLVGASKE